MKYLELTHSISVVFPIFSWVGHITVLVYFYCESNEITQRTHVSVNGHLRAVIT